MAPHAKPLNEALFVLFSATLRAMGFPSAKCQYYHGGTMPHTFHPCTCLFFFSPSVSVPVTELRSFYWPHASFQLMTIHLVLELIQLVASSKSLTRGSSRKFDTYPETLGIALLGPLNTFLQING